jgi:predicted phage terminase large subunit-like protein
MNYSANHLSNLSYRLKYQVCRDNLIDFAQAINPAFVAHKHSIYIAKKIEQWIKGELPSGKKNIMLFVPPQHGKSELFSRMAIPYTLGLNPDVKIIFATYNDTFAKKFNRQIQRNIDNLTYKNIFPETFLSGKNIVSNAKGSYVRNAKEFEVVGKKGSVLVVGVGAGATGNPADFVFIDDYIKDATQAYSDTFHNSAWEWYTNVLETRLHNNSRIGITFTRWSEKDIAAKILEIDSENWEVVTLPAIREDMSNPDDWREIGEALCPEWHSVKKILGLKKKNPATFSALYQQRPSPIGGGFYKFEWFRKINLSEIQNNPAFRNCPKIAYIDGAEGKSSNADYTAIACCYFLPVTRYNEVNRRNETIYDIYIRNISRCKLDTANAPAFLHSTMEKYMPKAPMKIEAKSAGISYIESMKTNYSYKTFEYEYPTQSNIKQTTPKYTRIMNAMPYVFQGNVFLVHDDLQGDNDWHKNFENEVNSFPKGQNDDQLDCVTNAIFDAMYGQVFVGQNDFRGYF